MHPTLRDPMDCSLPGSSVHGILQGRVLEWVAMPSCRGSSRPRGWTPISNGSCTGRKVLYCYSATWEVQSESVSRIWLFVTPWTTVAHQASLSMGFPRGRVLECVASSFSRGSSWPRNRTRVSCIAGRFFTNWAMREALSISTPRYITNGDKYVCPLTDT